MTDEIFDKQKIMDKLSKLLAMQGKGAVNLNEIEIANKFMKKLMQKYNIDINEVE